jgi:dGTPase
MQPPGLRPGERWRATYAADPANSRGRVVAEPASPTRSEFQRDRDRIIHSTAFRRLKHKTQVFLEHEGDHYRTRLTHTLEVAQIARSLARALGLDEDLAETLALAHDLGHTPFGHAGERALARSMSRWGGFDHNAQSLKIVTRLERRYADFDGLNLTWETLEGLVKHNGPLTDRGGRSLFPEPTPAAILDHDQAQSLELWSQASAEAQVAAIADDIAYNAHDIDDGLRAGILAFADLGEVPFLADILTTVRLRWPDLDQSRITHELQRRIITVLVEDVIDESFARIGAAKVTAAGDIRALGQAVVGFSDLTFGHVKSLRAFLFPRLYRNARIMADMQRAEQQVEAMFACFMEEPGKMPDEWAHGLTGADPEVRAARIGDFIAGMTDRYAIETHRRLFDDTGDMV